MTLSTRTPLDYVSVYKVYLLESISNGKYTLCCNTLEYPELVHELIMSGDDLIHSNTLVCQSSDIGDEDDNRVYLNTIECHKITYIINSVMDGYYIDRKFIINVLKHIIELNNDVNNMIITDINNVGNILLYNTNMVTLEIDMVYLVEKHSEYEFYVNIVGGDYDVLYSLLYKNRIFTVDSKPVLRSDMVGIKQEYELYTISDIIDLYNKYR